MKHFAVLITAATLGLTACTSSSQANSTPASDVSSTTSVSPPTGQIAFGARPNGAEDPEIDFIANADGTDLHRLGSPAIHAVFSPDGSQLVVDTAHGPAVTDPAGTITKLFRNDVGLGWCIWTPDGNNLLCQKTDAAGQDGLYSIRSSDGRGLTRLTQSPYHDVVHSAGECGGGDVPGDYSPDGSSLVFQRTRCGTGPDPSKDQTTALYVMNADGTGIQRITPYGAVGVEDDRPTWSPDGSEILFASADCSLRLTSPDGTDLRTVPIEGCAWNPEWSPDGQWIAFDLNVPVGSPDLFIARPDGTQQRRITDTPQRIEMLASWGN